MLQRHLPLTALAALLLLGPSVPAPAQTVTQAALLEEALDAAAGGDWSEARALARRTGSKVAADLVTWTRLRDGGGTWDDYARFLEIHPDWPAMPVLRKAAERQMPAGLNSTSVLAFFGGASPQTGTGSLRLAAALAATGETQAAQAEIARAWTTLSLTTAERQVMTAQWQETIAPQNAARLDMLLWRGLTDEATGMLPLVDPDTQALARARIATRRDDAGMQAAIAAVPDRLRQDPGLAYERYLYRVAKSKWQEAEAYLLEASTSADALGRPDFWMEKRPNLARQALEDGDVAGAYRIASQNFGTSGTSYADSEWVAGFIALTRMNDPDRAIAHFERFRAAVATPISLGRAGYWLGRAWTAKGDPVAAEAAFRAGALYQTSFYGQLAAMELGVTPDPDLAGATLPDWRRDPAMRASVTQAGYFLLVAGDDARASVFLRQAAAGQPADRRAAIAQMAIDLGRPQIGLRIAKDAAADGVVLPAQYYPMHAIADAQWDVPTEYALAIARQEFEFDASAASSVGARGLMQLMPATAQRMAERAGEPYEPARLTADPLYNARLGTTYLAQMLDYYDGSYLLATAAYNAGPGRVDRWVQEMGDPRDPSVDAIAWIEQIPFSETRNYVMRVIEGLHVYRARLKGTPPPVQIMADLSGLGPVHVSTRDMDELPVVQRPVAEPAPPPVAPAVASGPMPRPTQPSDAL